MKFSDCEFNTSSQRLHRIILPKELKVHMQLQPARTFLPVEGDSFRVGFKILGAVVSSTLLKLNFPLFPKVIRTFLILILVKTR